MRGALFAIDKYKDNTVGKQVSCVTCGLYKNCNSPKMKPKGGFAKKILVVGEFPYKSDDDSGEYFTGRGRILKRTLAKYGIDLDNDCLLMNALSCYPGKHLDKKKQQRAVIACRRFVFNAIKTHQPKVVILAGDIALKSVIGNQWKKDLDTIHKWRGFRIPDQELKTWICPILSPSFVYSADPEVEVVFNKDIQGIAEVVNEDFFPLFKKPEIEVIEDLKVLRSLTGFCAFDYETTGLKPYNKGHKIWCVSIADTPYHVYVFKMPKDKKQRAHFKFFLKNNAVCKVAQNMKFEDTWSEVILKTQVQNWKWDTQIAAHQLDNRPGITGLKFQSYVNFGIADYDSEVSPYLKAEDASAKNKLLDFVKHPENAEKMLTYCAWDSILEYRLYLEQTKKMEYDFLPF